MDFEFPDGLLTRTVCIDSAYGEVVLSDVLEAVDGDEAGTCTTLGWPPDQALAIGLAIAARARAIMAELAASEPMPLFEKRAA